MTYIFKNDSFLSFRCTSEEFHNFFTNIAIPNGYEESHEKYTFNRRFFLPYGRQNDMRFQGRQPFVISSKAGGPTRNLLLPTRNGGDCTLAWREILLGKAFQNNIAPWRLHHWIRDSSELYPSELHQCHLERSWEISCKIYCLVWDSSLRSHYIQNDISVIYNRQFG